MIYGVDCTVAPNSGTASKVRLNGWTWMVAYIGGPRAAAGHSGWPNAEVARLAELGFVFLPTYVGRTVPYDDPSSFNYTQGLIDGREATILTGACGFNEDTVLCLDAEAGDYQSNHPGFSEYVRGFAEVVNGAGHQLCLYSDTQTLGVFDSSMVDLKWGADIGRRPRDYMNPVSSAPPFGKFDPGLPPPWDAWQFAFGRTFDISSARDDFPFAEYRAS